jgi:hypothetical protein
MTAVLQLTKIAAQVVVVNAALRVPIAALLLPPPPRDLAIAAFQIAQS